MRYFLSVFLLVSMSSSGQSFDELRSINSIKEATEFIQAHPDQQGEIITISSDMDSSELMYLLRDVNKSGMHILNGYTYRTLEYKTEPVYRASYIYLNGSELPKNTIDSLRNAIIAEYKSGITFRELHGQYNMDGHKTGDLGWVEDGMLVKEFESAVKAQEKGDIFTVDVPYNNWYYVTLKTHDDTEIFTVTALKFIRR